MKSFQYSHKNYGDTNRSCHTECRRRMLRKLIASFHVENSSPHSSSVHFFDCKVCIEYHTKCQTCRKFWSGFVRRFYFGRKRKQPIIALAVAPSETVTCYFLVMWDFLSSRFFCPHRNWIILRNYGFLLTIKMVFPLRSFEMFSHNNRATELKINEHRFVRFVSWLFICQ